MHRLLQSLRCQALALVGSAALSFKVARETRRCGRVMMFRKRRDRRALGVPQAPSGTRVCGQARAMH